MTPILVLIDNVSCVYFNSPYMVFEKVQGRKQRIVENYDLSRRRNSYPSFSNDEVNSRLNDFSSKYSV